LHFYGAEFEYLPGKHIAKKEKFDIDKFLKQWALIRWLIDSVDTLSF
jgi:hypothetical protein